MFLHLSVILFTGGFSVQEGLCPEGVYFWRVSVQGGLCPGGVSVQGDLCLRVFGGGGLSGGVSVPGVISVQGGLGERWSLSGGVSVRGVSLSRRDLCWGDRCQGPRTVKSGRYASYWNAFLLILCDQS